MGGSKRKENYICGIYSNVMKTICRCGKFEIPKD